MRNNIIPSLDPSQGTCNFCQSVAVDVIEPRQLADYFEMLISIYKPDNKGRPLAYWMKHDWHLFSHKRMDMAHSKDLLGEILDDGNIVRENFSPAESYKSEGLARWETLRDELMYSNRYFLDVDIDTDRLKELLEHIIADALPTQWYRARIVTDDAPYTLHDMGAPPKRLATHGRANPTGIPYLYLGSQFDTAIAEIRPHPGETACVAEFLIREPLTAVDLRDPRKLVSPFLLADANAVGQMRADIPFLERLGNELTRPVLPRSAALDYIPSQYLCEFIKKSGYDGVVYRSSVSSGMNLALFDPAMTEAVNVTQHNIDRVAVETTPTTKIPC